MKTKRNIIFLSENGLSSNVISKLNENQVSVLVEKFKKENREQITKVVEPAKEIITVGPKGGTVELKAGQTSVSITPKPNEPGSVMVTEKELDEDMTLNVVNDPSATEDGMPTTESEIKEKFESKAQQGLFWARCNKCSSKNCKWCKMAKEFSDDTSKKQYKKMPEKKHPEKKVKVETKEQTQKYWENKILEMIDEEQKIKKRKLRKKSSENMILRNPKKMTMFSDEAPMELPIGQMFSIGKK